MSYSIEVHVSPQAKAFTDENLSPERSSSMVPTIIQVANDLIDWDCRKNHRRIALLDSSQAVLDLYLCIDPEIQPLKAAYMGRDETTDVLSFPNEEPIPQTIGLGYGSIFLGIEYHYRHFGSDLLMNRLLESLIHGFLHLIGYDHDEPHRSKEMYSLQKQLLKQIQYQGSG